MFGLVQKPFTYDKGKKMRTSLIDIEIYDANERLLDATLKLDRNVFNKSRNGLTYANHDDGYQQDAMQNYLSLSDMNEDDVTH